MGTNKRKASAASGSGRSKRGKKGSKGGKATPKPAVDGTARPARFSKVSATANTWQEWRRYTENADYAYGYMLLCYLPHEDPGYDAWDDGKQDDGPAMSDGEEPRKGDRRPRCARRKACMCFKPIEKVPNHDVRVSRAAYRLFGYQVTLASFRTPDNFGLYTTNDRGAYDDHEAYGLREVVEGLLVDFNDSNDDDWRERWALCEAAVLFLTVDVSSEMFLLPTSKRLSKMDRRVEFKRLNAMGRLLGCMFLTMLHKLEREGQLSPDSEAKNLGLIMGLNMQLFAKLFESYGLLEMLDDLKLNGSILAYSNKHNVVIKGGKGIEDAVKEVADLSEACEIPEGKDPWGWEDEYKRYVDGSPDQIIGGDRWDITTWTPERRKKFVFDRKNPEDPLDSATIEAIEDGHAMLMT